MEKVIVDGKVAVLYSPGHGAGWSTDGDNCMFDPETIQWVLNGKLEHDRPNFIEKFGSAFYDGGADQLEVEWVRQGELFRITEHDGYESVELKSNDDGWVIA